MNNIQPELLGLPRLIGLLGLLCLLTLNSCAARTKTTQQAQPDAPKAFAQAVWSKFQHAQTPFSPDTPFRLTTSLRYSTPETGHRVVLRMWGNGTETVRFDMESGIGSLVARVRSGADGFVAYSPSEKKAVVHPRSRDALLRFGVPVPFSVKDLMNLLRGQYAAVFGKNYQRATLVTGSALAYTLPPKTIGGTLVIGENGLPVKWLGPAVQKNDTAMQWRVEFSRYTANGLPGKLAFRYGDSHKAIFLHRDGNLPEQPFTTDQLQLVLPPDTIIKPLREMMQDG